jgi:hypothetical protein
MPKPFDPGGAGIVTVGTSCFFSEVWPSLESDTTKVKQTKANEMFIIFFIKHYLFRV